MSTDMTWQTQSSSSDATEKLASKIAAKLKGGEVIELISDLGGGKTTFVRGLVKGLGSRAHVASPTFTISRQYKAGLLNVYHFDFYRLNDAGHLKFELAEAFDDPGGVVVIEWGKLLESVLPAERLRVEFKASGENERQITFYYPKKLDYLFKEVKA